MHMVQKEKSHARNREAQTIRMNRAAAKLKAEWQSASHSFTKDKEIGAICVRCCHCAAKIMYERVKCNGM